jgi:LCP family protein required for cell wall assembly
VLLIGVDAGRKNEPTHNTDTMMVITADPGSGKLGVISLPRDTQNVPLPASWPAARAYGSVYPNKINTLANAAKARPDLFPGAGKNGYGALAGVLGNLYGLDIPYYVSVDLSGFRDAINALGGVVVDVQAPVNDPYYPADDGRGYLKLYIPPGIQYMDGAKSLAYARSRHGAGNDFVRASRQERVVTSVREQFDIGTLLQPGVIDELMRILKGSIKTNIPPGLLPQLASLAQHVDLNRRVSVVLQPPSYGQVCYPCPPYGLWAITPNVAAIRRAVKEIFTTTPAQRRQREALEGEAAIVSVLNGTPGDNTRSTRIADQLASLGVNATVPPVEGGRADRSDHTDTVIIAYNGAEQSKPETIALLQKSLGGTLQTAADPEQAADIVVIVGTGTQVPKPSG